MDYPDAVGIVKEMATTVTLESDIVEAVKLVTHERSEARAVRKALEEYLRIRKLRELADMAGKVDFRFSNHELEETEDREQQQSHLVNLPEPSIGAE